MGRSKCKGCGAEIVWIKTDKGKSMPCDPDPVPYWERRGAPGKVVTPNGIVVSCDFEGPRETSTGIGYVFHFSTCPKANDFRLTLHELSRYYKLREQIEKDEEILESFEAKARPGAQVLTGMPHAPGVRDRVGDLAVEIADLKDQIAALQAEAEVERVKVERYVASIESDQTRMIFRLRFLRCLTWAEVAYLIGGRNTEDAVKSACYRYLESCNGVTPDDA